MRSLVRCLALSHIVHGTSNWRTVEVHSELAKAYLDLRGRLFVWFIVWRAIGLHRILVEDMPAQAVKHSQTARDMGAPLYQRLRDDIGETGSESGSDDLLSRQKDELVEVLSVLFLAQFVLGRAFCCLNKLI